MTEILGDKVSAATTDQTSRLVVLPFNKSFEISFKNIQVRFFRSMITTMSLVLAVSFLCFTNVGMQVADGLLASGDPDKRQILINAGYDIGPQDTSVAATAKQRWIVILSLVVCVVGIVNAQLMAVTERFREIGTMKCLGALDGLVVKIFIIEAGIQGMTGSLLGSLLGMVSALLMGILRFGMLSISSISWAAVLNSMATGILIGTMLSLLGALYPAFMAARMQPVDAMRVEQ